jgi:very-short-patch-repair endonuclease
MRNPLLQSRARRLRNEATDAERLLWRHLRHRQIAGYRFRRQIPVAGFIADFASLEAKVVVELDGGQHLDRADHDKQRDRLIEAQGFLVLRFWDNQVFQDTQAVPDEIIRAPTMRVTSVPSSDNEHRSADLGDRPA